jgi:LPXTG-motif cell wall-anchored protein
MLPLKAMPTTFLESVKATETTNVVISNLAFHPKNVTITVGSTITWENNDPLIYTLWFVKAEDGTTYTKAGKEGLSDPILPNASWSQTFTETVTLKYYSFERLWITGFITVVPIHDVAVTSVTPSPTEVTIGDNITITVVVKNEGTVAENFTVTVYSNNTAIDTQTVTNLAAKGSKTLNFFWDTTNATEGTYAIKAEASQVAGETDTTDNTLTSDVMVTVKPTPFLPFPYTGIIAIILLIIAIVALGFGAYLYTKRREKISKS